MNKTLKASLATLLFVPTLHAQPACDTTQNQFTLINWNAWEMGNNTRYPFSAVRQNLLQYNPDVITLQEVKHCGNGFYSLFQPNVDFNYANMWCAQAQAYPGTGAGSAGSYGIGIASHYSSLSDKVLHEINGRTILGEKYQINGKAIWVWSAHTAFVTSETDKKRLQNFNTISAVINDHVLPNEAVILTGDFNANLDDPWGSNDPERGEMQVFWDNGFEDLWREQYPDINDSLGYTYYNISRIDYILARNLPEHWHIDALEVLNNVWCELGLNNEGKSISCGADGSIDHDPILLRFDTSDHANQKTRIALLKNTGAEQGTAHWSGDIESLNSNACDSVPAAHGSKLFAVGGVCTNESALGHASQHVDLNDYAADIQRANTTLYWGGLLRNYNGTDVPSMTVSFHDAQGNTLASHPARGSLRSSWTLQSNKALVPETTSYAVIHLTGTRHGGTDNDSYFDEVFLDIEVASGCE
ncbi:endonuclease/exonuclease/phosphatase family protein [Pseudoalteromonas sp. MMG012]|uniref:endonuclease/exonuclease/phosphatase family protein n=1 Tax=Pseudoalteromonas sp. MMG012 TaxID=2822686 RepID=UPI001B39EAB5|nr:endonuclease/exonuclease/phosphatase family protein [Pseudoalteromonas sp. MMG012]MBQ4852946.1 endonuclease/exonuclease/phosphatase family protein [Pseudoalteromonas sp. MMG012]